MTVATTARTYAWDGDGSTKVFPIPFPFVAATDLTVKVGGVLTAFSITGDPRTAAASLVFATAPAVGVGNVTVEREVPTLQSVTFPPQGRFTPTSLEMAIDRVVMMLIDEAARRAASDAAIIASGAVPANVGAALVTPTGSALVKSVADWLAKIVYVDEDADGNITFGDLALAAKVAGALSNIAIGVSALNDLTTGDSNIAVGRYSLQKTTGADSNVAIGTSALSELASGGGNVAIGTNALAMLAASVAANVAIGLIAAMWVKGSGNVAVGESAMEGSTFNALIADDNVAVGYRALRTLTSGSRNVAVGKDAGQGITTGSGNTILGSGVTGLAAGTENAIFLASGGGVRGYFDPTIGWLFNAAQIYLTGDTLRVGTAKTPASASAAGSAGEICWDANYIYVCVATNTWKRVAISTW